MSVARRPTPVAGAFAVAVTFVALWTLGASPTALAVEAAGVGLLAVGFALWRRGWRVSGALVAVLGVGAVVGAVAVQASAVAQLSGYFRFLPGVVGAAVLALALVPVRGAGSRTLLKVGTALVFVGVVLSGVFQSVSVGTLLLTGAATVVAWDAGEHAINLGEQLGRGTNAVETEAVHVVGTGAVALGAVETAKFAGGVGPSGLSLSSFALVLVAVVLFAVALHD